MGEKRKKITGGLVQFGDSFRRPRADTDKRPVKQKKAFDVNSKYKVKKGHRIETKCDKEIHLKALFIQ